MSTDDEKTLEEKAARTRESGQFTIPLGDEAMALSTLLEFVSDMFPSVPHDKIGVYADEEGITFVLAADAKIVAN